MFPDIDSTLQAVFRWFHIIAGITWIGHLYFFNFVNTPFQGGLDKELKGDRVGAIADLRAALAAETDLDRRQGIRNLLELLDPRR